MQHQGEYRAISQMITNRQKELLYFFLMDFSGEAMTLIDVMSMRDAWIGNLIFANICQVVKEHPQGNQRSPDCGRCPSQPLLPFDEFIDIMNADCFSVFRLTHLKKMRTSPE